MAESGAIAPATPSRWPVRAAGLAAVLLFLWLVARFWHPVYGFTRFLQLDASNDNTKIEAFRAMPVFVDRDRKSTRLNSSHGSISYAVFCLKKKKTSIL